MGGVRDFNRSDLNVIRKFRFRGVTRRCAPLSVLLLKRYLDGSEDYEETPLVY